MILPPLYAILDTEAAARQGRTIHDLARGCVRGGGRLLQVRASGAPSGHLLTLADAVMEIARPVSASVIVNDRADIAMLCDAAGVHVGQEDLPASAARALVGSARIVGLSTHTREQIDRAGDAPIDYLAVGPVFDTRTKDTGYAPVGVSLVEYAAARAAGRLPIVAIGGITLATAPLAIAAGAASVAVISDLLATGDIEARTREYLDALSRR